MSPTYFKTPKRSSSRQPLTALGMSVACFVAGLLVLLVAVALGWWS
jgi:hypothetical protein